MRRYFGTLGVAALFLLLACLPASAGPICNFCGVTLKGVANTTASGTFSFSNGQFSNISISFSGNSMFGGIQAIDTKAIAGHLDKKTGFWSFVWTTHVQGNSIVYSILFNPTTNQFWALGSIYKNRNNGGYFDNYFTVPEGGAILSYLFLSGAAVFAGIILSGRQRRTAQ
jgi:hypothetical protein